MQPCMKLSLPKLLHWLAQNVRNAQDSASIQESLIQCMHLCMQLQKMWRFLIFAPSVSARKITTLGDSLLSIQQQFQTKTMFSSLMRIQGHTVYKNCLSLKCLIQQDQFIIMSRVNVPWPWTLSPTNYVPRCWTGLGSVYSLQYQVN